MSHFLKRFDPVEVRYLIDAGEIQEITAEMLGEVSSLVNTYVSYEYTAASEGNLVRPMITLEETEGLTEKDRNAILSTGFNLDAPFDNGDEVFRTIFGDSHVVIAATEDEDGVFFTVEVPYEDFKSF
ncbi:MULTISPECIES: hypothetical protein [Salimicrobium]|uniref:Uncharacterized protein n=2 Tax=Salimicrobium TaxID=351195 RepID=A0ABY1KTY5_9BACI|nr:MULTISPECIES: hypothetical protein [Salimicrobium]SDY14689.1 hypothetical protein SAMN04488081_2208 [Salimicrobium album]SIS77538.1 hypothetical protein SAMN05421758_105193 [Salimicrobium salexigens]